MEPIDISDNILSHSLIEKLIRKSVPDVIFVNFKSRPLISYDGGLFKGHQTLIEVIVDPGKVYEGNTYAVAGNRFVYSELYNRILEDLKTYLDINVNTFRSEYGLRLFIVSTSMIYGS